MHSDSASDFISVTIKSVITHQMIGTSSYAPKATFSDVTDNESSASLWDARTELQQPAFSVRIEERVRQVVAVVLGDFERLVFDAVVQVLQERRDVNNR